MIYTEILGWIATSAVLSSFLFKEMIKLRIINALGAFLWLLYAILKKDSPLICVNFAILIIHGFWFYSNYKKWKS